MKLLEYDGPIATVGLALGRVIVLNLLFVLTCLPLVTIGTAVTALYAVCFDKDAEGGVVRRYLKVFRSNWKTTIVPWLIYLGILAAILVDLYLLLLNGIPLQDFLIVLFAVVGIVWLFSASWFFPQRARYDAPAGQCFRNAVILSFGHPLRTLETLIPWLLLPASLFFSWGWILTAAFVFVQFGFVLAARLGTRLILPVFKQLDSNA